MAPHTRTVAGELAEVLAADWRAQSPPGQCEVATAGPTTCQGQSTAPPAVSPDTTCAR